MVPSAPCKPLTGGDRLAAVAVAALTLLGLSAFALAPRAGDPVAVFAPFMGAARVTDIVGAAGGSLLALGGRPDIVIAIAKDAEFSTRLYAAGAFLVLDARAAPWCRRLVTGRDEGLR